MSVKYKLIQVKGDDDEDIIEMMNFPLSTEFVYDISSYSYDRFFIIEEKLYERYIKLCKIFNKDINNIISIVENGMCAIIENNTITYV